MMGILAVQIWGRRTESRLKAECVWMGGNARLGDMAYMDGPRVNCEAMPAHKHCNCTSDWLHQAPNSCMAGPVSHSALTIIFCLHFDFGKAQQIQNFSICTTSVIDCHSYLFHPSTCR